VRGGDDTVRWVGARPNYRKPDWFTRNVFNRVVAGLTRLGISVAGSRVLEVPGRKTGEPRRTPVNLLGFEGNRYLVAPRGQTQWVRNLREAGRGNLLLGRRSEPFRAVEVPDTEKEPILREYLRRCLPGESRTLNRPSGPEVTTTGVLEYGSPPVVRREIEKRADG
jgi:deazaflavin-dependent oxidoreductase (nitroreductase family)